MPNELQKKTAQAIVNIFETGRALGDYGQVTLLVGDTGHLTYGRSQTTLASGNLFLLIKAYVGAASSAFAGALAPYLARLAAPDLSLDHDTAFRALLREAGGDPVMRDAQDAFFERVYWAPAAARTTQLGLATPLAHAAIYDSQVHGSLQSMIERTQKRHGSVAKLGERAWIGAYVGERGDWLAGHSNPLLRKTVYRMDALKALIGANQWDLPLPLSVRGGACSRARRCEFPPTMAQGSYASASRSCRATTCALCRRR